MKKYVLPAVFLLSIYNLSFAQQRSIFNPQIVEVSQPENKKVLQNWIENNHIKGRTVTTEEEFKKLPNFPQQFLNYKVRIIKDRTVIPRDYNHRIITVLLFKDETIALIDFG